MKESGRVQEYHFLSNLHSFCMRVLICELFQGSPSLIYYLLFQGV